MLFFNKKQDNETYRNLYAKYLVKGISELNFPPYTKKICQHTRQESPIKQYVYQSIYTHL